MRYATLTSPTFECETRSCVNSNGIPGRRQRGRRRREKRHGHADGLHRRTYPGKLAAERAAKRVAGVRAVANDMEVRLKLDRTDTGITTDSAKALELRSTIPEGVEAIVHNGHVTLTGHATWLFQKQSAERAVSHIRGVRSVLNHITVRTQPVAVTSSASL